MITEDYVSYETSKLLKEKGFDEATYPYYLPNASFYLSPMTVDNKNLYAQGCVSAPTLQMAMKWLREVHHYYIQVMLDGWACGGHTGYYVVIQKTDSDFEMMLQDVRERVFYDTYEEAVEDAVKYLLEEFVKD